MAGDEQDHEGARQRLVRDIKLVHGVLPATGLSAREKLEVRRDLVYLVGESHRSPYRPEVVAAVWRAVLEQLGPGVPAELREGHDDEGGITRSG